MKGAHGLGSLTEAGQRQGQRTTAWTVLARYGWTLAAALLVAVVYGYSLSLLPSHVFWMPDEGAKLFQIEACSLSWTDHGMRYRIPFAGQRLLPGNEFLPQFDVFPEPKILDDGRLYLEFDTPVVFPLLTAPFYHRFGTAGLYVLPAVSGWLVALFSGVMASWFGRTLAPFAVLIVGLATPVWFYSVVFWEHTLATLVGLTAVGLVVWAPRRVESLVAIVPMILLAGVFRTEMAALGAALAVAWVAVLVNGPGPEAHGALDHPIRSIGRRRVAVLALGATVALITVLRFSLTSRHRALIGALPERFEQAFFGIANIPRGLFEVFINSQHLGPRVGGLWIAAGVVSVLLGLAAPLIHDRRARATALVVAMSLMLVCTSALIFTGEPYRGLHGLFPVAPFAIIWPLALRHGWRRHDAPLLALGTATWVYLLLTFLALGMTYLHQGRLDVGMQWGQRYLLTAYPMLAILSLIAVRALWASLPAGRLRDACIALVALLVVAGIGLELRGIQMLRGTRGLMAQWDQAMQSEGPIVTTVWWIVPAVAHLFLTHDMFFTWPLGMPHWVDVARQHGITTFTLAHTEPVALDKLGSPAIHAISDTRMITGGLLLTKFQIDPVPTP